MGARGQGHMVHHPNFPPARRERLRARTASAEATVAPQRMGPVACPRCPVRGGEGARHRERKRAPTSPSGLCSRPRRKTARAARPGTPACARRHTPAPPLCAESTPATGARHGRRARAWRRYRRSGSSSAAHRARNRRATSRGRPAARHRTGRPTEDGASTKRRAPHLHPRRPPPPTLYLGQRVAPGDDSQLCESRGGAHPGLNPGLVSPQCGPSSYQVRATVSLTYSVLQRECG